MTCRKNEAKDRSRSESGSRAKAKMPELFGRELTDREIVDHREKLEAIYMKICDLQNGITGNRT